MERPSLATVFPKKKQLHHGLLPGYKNGTEVGRLFHCKKLRENQCFLETHTSMVNMRLSVECQEVIHDSMVFHAIILSV